MEKSVFNVEILSDGKGCPTLCQIKIEGNNDLLASCIAGAAIEKENIKDFLNAIVKKANKMSKEKCEGKRVVEVTESEEKASLEGLLEKLFKSAENSLKEVSVKAEDTTAKALERLEKTLSKINSRMDDMEVQINRHIGVSEKRIQPASQMA